MDTPPTAADTVIPLIVLIVLIAFVAWMIYLLVSSGFQSTSPQDPVRTDIRSPFSIECPAGQCAVNIFSGFKTCPKTDVPILIDPAVSVCSNRYICDNPLAPFAVQYDGSTDINGVCDPQVECPCLRLSRCPDYILSAFTTSNGNPYQTLAGQRILFPQTSTFVSSSSGNLTNNTPLEFTNPGTTFCLAPLAWLPLSNPGCNFFSGADGNSMTYSDLLICMGMPNNCDGILSNPCLQGTLAIVSDDPDLLTQSTVAQAQYGCVRGESCPCGLVAIYDTKFGGVICQELPP